LLLALCATSTLSKDVGDYMKPVTRRDAPVITTVKPDDTAPPKMPVTPAVIESVPSRPRRQLGSIGANLTMNHLSGQKPVYKAIIDGDRRNGDTSMFGGVIHETDLHSGNTQIFGGLGKQINKNTEIYSKVFGNIPNNGHNSS
ncbi:hypothetical protein PMAYCL1PPCAC_05863, partial [Pristionchus mayeri]